MNSNIKELYTLVQMKFPKTTKIRQIVSQPFYNTNGDLVGYISNVLSIENIDRHTAMVTVRIKVTDPKVLQGLSNIDHNISTVVKEDEML